MLNSFISAKIWLSFLTTGISSLTHLPSIQSDPAEQLPQLPRQPSGPQSFPAQYGTQTGFVEYELISSYEFTLNNGEETTISVLENEGTTAIISGFNGGIYPHFVMMTYEDESLDEKMIELNEEFLGRITFQ